MAIERQREIQRRRSRKAKMARLKVRYTEASGGEKTRLLEKALRVAPSLTKEQFLSIVKGK